MLKNWFIVHCLNLNMNRSYRAHHLKSVAWLRGQGTGAHSSLPRRRTTKFLKETVEGMTRKTRERCAKGTIIKSSPKSWPIAYSSLSHIASIGCNVRPWPNSPFHCWTLAMPHLKKIKRETLVVLILWWFTLNFNQDLEFKCYNLILNFKF